MCSAVRLRMPLSGTVSVPVPRHRVARRWLGPRHARGAAPLRDVREHVLTRDAAVAPGARDLRRIERVLGEQPAHHRRQFPRRRVARLRSARATVRAPVP